MIPVEYLYAVGVVAILVVRTLCAAFDLLYRGVSDKYLKLDSQKRRNASWHSTRTIMNLVVVGLTTPFIIHTALESDHSAPIASSLYIIVQLGTATLIAIWVAELCYKPGLHWATVLHHLAGIFCAMVAVIGWPIDLRSDPWFIKVVALYGWFSGCTFFSNAAVVVYRLIPARLEHRLPSVLFAAFVNDVVCRIIFQVSLIVSTFVFYGDLQLTITKVLIPLLFVAWGFAELYSPYVLWALYRKVSRPVAGAADVEVGCTIMLTEHDGDNSKNSSCLGSQVAADMLYYSEVAAQQQEKKQEHSSVWCGHYAAAQETHASACTVVDMAPGVSLESSVSSESAQ